MKVNLPDGAQGHDEEMRDGSVYHKIDNIKIGRGKSMVMTVTGLPSPAAWKIWAPRLVGILVIFVILGGLGIAMFGRHARQTPLTQNLARKNAILDELVDLERSGADPRRKEQLTAELEKLWSA